MIRSKDSEELCEAIKRGGLDQANHNWSLSIVFRLVLMNFDADQGRQPQPDRSSYCLCKNWTKFCAWYQSSIQIGRRTVEFSLIYARTAVSPDLSPSLFPSQSRFCGKRPSEDLANEGNRKLHNANNLRACPHAKRFARSSALRQAATTGFYRTQMSLIALGWPVAAGEFSAPR